MKIVVYSPTYNPIKDGTSIQAIRLVEMLSNEFQVFAIGYVVNRDMHFEEKLLNIEDGVERLRPEFISTKGKFPKLSGKKVSKRILEIHPDVVHIRGWYQLDVVESIIEASKTIGSKLYWHGDGLHECHEAYKNEEGYLKLIQKAIHEGVNFIGNSKQDTEIFLGLGVEPDKIFEIPPILTETKQNKKDWNNPQILTLGRFFPYKGHKKVIDAVEKIGGDIELIVAGASDTSYFQEFLDDNKGRATIIADPSDQLVNELYNISTHFVLASDIETLGIVTLEATKAGCVPLVRKIGGIPSYLPENHLFETENEFPSKLEELLDPKNAHDAYEALATLRSKLSKEKIYAKLKEIYEDSK